MKDLESLLKAQGFTQPLRVQAIPGSESPLYLLAVPGKQALENWQKLHGLVKQSQYWPVVMGPASNFDSLQDLWPEADSLPTPAALLKKAASLDLAGWLSENTPEVLPDEAFDPEEFEEFGEFLSPESMQPTSEFTTHLDILSRKPYPEVLIGLVPTPDPWEVPAWLYTGGWNACPEAEVHIRLMETWFVRYGAELVGLTHDVIELAIARPVQEIEEARELALTQYAYCPDIIDQGVQTIENLAQTLLGSSVWYFWWD
jgi:hypothetical protein